MCTWASRNLITRLFLFCPPQLSAYTTSFVFPLGRRTVLMKWCSMELIWSLPLPLTVSSYHSLSESARSLRIWRKHSRPRESRNTIEMASERQMAPSDSERSPSLSGSGPATRALSFLYSLLNFTG
ncbi:hypothetical protein PF005_g5601 [Phytophthora fragariae]|uniref:Secreted protein n=1 Tax=Phytophthora fragariae TaxID=53985 RepID=A0A6A3YY32_9STRA|nr:hypothetical protein PF009_g26687 [Phytophthora fragariae]KAE9005136.1 hypothetical protein PF011_g12162 [Phytophthora fragariae]KAE9107426.1 hypothetical protein PF010_g12269 [Phytophthora fragariae]KAE9222955.1 hypothetical protein PF004_g12659 [Phytophthora fragariae]KAE9225270.1 hypothetical protein PF005_g5601 [Phytophthora fragariae]